MKIHTNNFKENIITMGREIDAIISYNLNNEVIELNADDISSITLHYEGSILKSVMKQIDIECNNVIPEETVLNCQFGLKVNGEYEYINLGNYVVYKVEKQEDTKDYKLTCYDKMLYTMVDYKNLSIEYPISVRDYINVLCENVGLVFKNSNDEFANYDKLIPKEMYLDEEYNSLGYTFRDVFDDLAEVTASTICMDDNADELEIRYINDTEDTINEDFLKNINVNFGEKYGPVNSIVLSRSAGSDNIYLKDDESIEENGLCEIKIEDNQIMSLNNRDEYLPDILEKLDGLEYYINDFLSTGITYYELCDKYNVIIGENTYTCIMLNDEIKITQGLEEIIHTEAFTKGETDYKKADTTDRRLNQAYLMVDKQKLEIEGLVRKTETIEENLQNVYDKETVNQLVINAGSGITNTFSEAGGNNIFRNTGLWFEEAREVNTYTFPSSNIYPSSNTYSGALSLYEYWTGYAKKTSNDSAVNHSSIIVQKGSFIQEQEVPNGVYSISFYYKKLKQFANTSVTINDVEYPLNEMEYTQFYTGEQNSETGEYVTQPINVNSKRIKVEFKSSIDDGLEVYDLMCNKGNVKLSYSQNENETTTDTVNISKGITITSTNMETIFKANANGIRILTLSGNVVAYFTDKGLSTKELIVENEAQIVKTLWQEVDDQTWITRI